jgi:signal transduction histidine kinase
VSSSPSRPKERRGLVQHRAGRAIALSRLVLSSVFLLAIYIDPSQPTLAPERVYFVLVLYVATALGVAGIAWSSWWWDHRLALPVHILDMAVFAVVVFSTEGYTSPFFTFSLFLLLSAAIRWGGPETARTAVAVNLLFLLSGLLSSLVLPTEIDVQRLLIRSTYLVVLSLLFIWFTFDRDRLAERSSLHKRLRGTTDDSNVLQLICDHVSARIEAARITCVSYEEGDPWHQVCEHHSSGDLPIKRSEAQTGLLSALPEQPFLFDPSNEWLLVGRAQSARCAKASPVLHEFAQQNGLGAMLGIPVRGDDFDCAVFVSGRRVLSVDDLTTGGELAEEIGFIQKQSLFNNLSEQAATNRTRLSIGRDLHDSVAQLVAGISFRLEGFKRSGKGAAELADDIDVLQQELAVEQRQLRALIADLRQPQAARGKIEITPHLAELSERLGRQWDIVCTFDGPATLRIGQDAERELNQMVREGVANAVRHGRADRVAINLHAVDSRLQLEIADNGSGMAMASVAGAVQPRTLRERAESMGGVIEADSSAAGTTIKIVLPIETEA